MIFFLVNDFGGRLRSIELCLGLVWFCGVEGIVLRSWIGVFKMGGGVIGCVFWMGC